MQSKRLSFDLLEPYLGTKDGTFPYAGEDGETDWEYRWMLRVLTRVMEGELTDRQRECVQLYYFDGMKMREIADYLGVKTPAVSRHLKRAREKMEHILRYTCDRLS